MTTTKLKKRKKTDMKKKFAAEKLNAENGMIYKQKW